MEVHTELWRPSGGIIRCGIIHLAMSSCTSEVDALNAHLLLQGILSTGGGGGAQRVRWADEGVDDAVGFSVGGASREQVA